MTDQNTRPQPSAEPVAWLYQLPNGEESLSRKQNSWGHPDCEGWTETPLYPTSALEAARREALEQAAKACEDHRYGKERDFLNTCKLREEHRADIATAIRAVKENTNG